MRFALAAEHLLLEREAGQGTRTYSVAKRGYMIEAQEVLVAPPKPQGWMAKSSVVAKWGALEGRLIEFSGMLGKDRAIHLRRRGWGSLQRQ
eukprot:9190217-Pyramimonas_sp.AAC.1